MISKVKGESLEIARQLCMLTQKEVAASIDITQGKLSKAEHDLQELDTLTLERLANLYGVPTDFFYQEPDPTPVSHYYYRKRITTNKTSDALVALVRIFKMFIETFLNPIDLPIFDLPTYTPSAELSVQEIADRTRYSLGIYRGPIPNLTTLLENHGIIVIKIDFGTDKLDGLSTFTQKGRRLIFINSRMSNDRMRFSLAHELGHSIMHLDTIPSPSQDVEQEANDFAAQFLLPAQEIDAELCGVTLYELGILKRKWKVSIKALLYRAKTLQAISANTFRNLQILYSKKGYNKSEPLPLAYETPTLLSEIIKLYKNELGYSDQDLKNLMHISDREYNTFFVHPQFARFRVNFLR